jgi:hypothetical protein
MRYPSLVVILALSTIVAACSKSSTVRAPGPSPTVVVTGDGAEAPRSVRVPPGHYPRHGDCRLWYPDRPPGHQPRPVPCSQLRSVAGTGAFILHNGRAWDSNFDWREYERRSPGSVPRVILELVSASR